MIGKPLWNLHASSGKGRKIPVTSGRLRKRNFTDRFPAMNLKRSPSHADPFRPVSFLHSCRPAKSMFCDWSSTKRPLSTSTYRPEAAGRGCKKGTLERLLRSGGLPARGARRRSCRRTDPPSASQGKATAIDRTAVVEQKLHWSAVFQIAGLKLLERNPRHCGTVTIIQSAVQAIFRGTTRLPTKICTASPFH